MVDGFDRSRQRLARLAIACEAVRSSRRAILKIPAVNNRLVIAIDGPSGAGKSSIARSLARRMGITYIDTGAMNRAVALWALRADIDINDSFRVERLARSPHRVWPRGRS